MDITKLSLFQMVSTKLDWLSERQKLISQNVANADTPDYQSMDLKEYNFKELLARSRRNARMTSTNDAHLSGTSIVNASNQHLAKASESGRYELTPTGNGVELEEEMMKSTDTAMQYQLASNLYRKSVDMLKTAIGRPSS